MIISTKGRYALRVLLDLAQQTEPGYISLTGIAQRQEISRKYLEMIVSTLAKAGILESQRGKEGGYRLSCSPSEISIGRVMKLMEGSLAPVSCLACDSEPCERADICLTLPLWRNLDYLIDSYLDGVSIQDLLDGKIPMV